MVRIDQRASDDQCGAFDEHPDDLEWLDAAAACALLGIKRQTLYAYASRGLVRSAPGEGRERRYRREDLERLRARSAARSGHAAVASGALRWGEPVLDTAISGIGADGPHYRGRSAVALARDGARFETVATWLWAARWDEGARFDARALGIDARRAARFVPEGARPLDRLLAGLPLIAVAEGASRLALDEGEARAPALVRRLAALLALEPRSVARLEGALAAPSIAHAALLALDVRPTRRACAAVDRALVLMADHELNPSSFAARVAAGAGADLHASVIAALATLTGPAHGGSCDRVEALLAEAREPEEAARVLRDRRRRGDALPGFGHPLYPGGDPRTPPLLEIATELAPKSTTVRKVRAFAAAMELAGGERPAVDTGLVAVAGALGMPPGSAAALMAIGRSAGWIAHALEQRSAGFQLRPRARYVSLAGGASPE